LHLLLADAGQLRVIDQVEGGEYGFGPLELG
jgi:hypothetical protein